MNQDELCLGCMEARTDQKNCPHCGWRHDAAPESLLHLPPGTVMENKYLIGRVLGQGGFGITYLAWDMKLDIKLAIKEFFPQGLVTRIPDRYEVTAYSGEQKDQYQFGLERFLSEAKTLARFAEHPNIVTVRDFFEVNGTAYMVMNYVVGLTLEEYLQENGGSIPFRTALDVMMPVMDALREVHNAGFMHRDISPDNIFIDVNGRIVLIDFGAARQDLGEKSKSLSVVIKAGYAPEEQYRSRGKQGPWTDVYAVAATMYRAVTGVTPLESIERVMDDDLELPSAKGADIGRENEEVLFKALSVIANERYQDMQQFQQAMQRVATTPGFGENTWQEQYAPSIGSEHSGKVTDTEQGFQGEPEKSFQSGMTSGPVVKRKTGANRLSDLNIGDRVVDVSWSWEFRTEENYSGRGKTKPVTWIVVAHDHYESMGFHVTLLSEELIGKFAFDDSKRIGKYGNNYWGDGSGTTDAKHNLRLWLNSEGIHTGEGFYRAFGDDFRGVVLTTPVPNKEWKQGTLYITEDKVFIPSTAELVDKEHSWTYKIGRVFPYFAGALDGVRPTMLPGEGKHWYWTRSPDPGRANYVRGVSSSGSFCSLHANRDNNGGVRPALNLSSEILVSEIPNKDGVYQIEW